MVVGLYFTIASAFAVWLSPEVIREGQKVDDYTRALLAVVFWMFILFWPAMILFVYLYNDGRWK